MSKTPAAKPAAQAKAAAAQPAAAAPAVPVGGPPPEAPATAEPQAPANEPAQAEPALAPAFTAEPGAPLSAVLETFAPARFRIRCTRKRGIFRAGRFWPLAGDVVERDAFSDEQWAALEAEPLLTVTPAFEPGEKVEE